MATTPTSFRFHPDTLADLDELASLLEAKTSAAMKAGALSSVRADGSPGWATVNRSVAVQYAIRHALLDLRRDAGKS
jgi:hypothetical protein